MGTQGRATAQGQTETQDSTRQRGNATRYVLLAMLAVAFLATGGIFVKQSGLGPINTGFYRMLFSIPLLWPLAYSVAVALLLGWRIRERRRKAIPVPRFASAKPLKFFKQKPE